MSEESDILDDYENIVDVSNVDDVDTNTEDLNDLDKLLITTKEESNPFYLSDIPNFYYTIWVTWT